MNLAHEQVEHANVHVEVELHYDAHHGHIEYSQIDAIEQREIAERAEFAHFASSKLFRQIKSK